MANILVRPLYEQKQREFGVAGASLTRFQDDFIAAVNRAVNEINRRADLETRLTRITSLEGSVALDEKYEDVLSTGVSLNLHLMGSRPSKGAEQLVPMLERRFIDGISDMYYDLFNLREDADSDDEIIGIAGMN